MSEKPLEDAEIKQYWNQNAGAWTQLARAGYDVYRDYLNTPAFLAMLPNVAGLSGLDIGCGEGYNTRLLAELGAKMIALDFAEVFIQYAKELETEKPLNIDYQVASADALPFADVRFDFVTGFMSLMDIARMEDALDEVYRVLKPDGFFQFSIMHPCFDTPLRRNLRDENGRTYVYEIGGYFDNPEWEVAEWIFSAAPSELKEQFPKFRIPYFRKILSSWLNMLIEKRFVLERFGEPQPDNAIVQKVPSIQDAQVIPYFLHIRVRKPGV
jgi:ubiquinone/menaquinone biosynthesis C-methylase UbiE